MNTSLHGFQAWSCNIIEISQKSQSTSCHDVDGDF